jgi:hypothetical protein
MTWWKWSTTAATNASADATINWAEGMSPSAVNDSARAEMAANAKYFADQSGSLLTTGTSTAYALATNGGFDTLAHLSGNGLHVRFHTASGSAPTLNVDGLGAKPLQVASGTALGTGVIAAQSVWGLTYDDTIPAFILRGVPAQVQDATVATASLQAGAVTAPKLGSIADKSFFANFSGGAASPTVFALSGVSASGSTVSVPFPPPASFKNLSIKVASNTTVTVAADYVTTTDGTAFKTTALSGTINLGTTGANALDAGTIAIDTWYAIWAISKPDGTTAGLASTSFTAPTLPSGYTMKARIGAVQTIHSTATLYGTWQLGRRAQYVVGLAQTSVLPAIASAASGTINGTTFTGTSTSVARFVPPTASSLRFVLSTPNAGAQAAAVAPNANFAGYNSATNPIPWVANGASATPPSSVGEFILESTNVFYAASGAAGLLQAMGWEDNI